MASNLRELLNVNFGTLDNSKNKYVVSYNSTSNVYSLVSSDSVLSSDNVLDGDLPNDFVTQIENEVDLGNIDFAGVDGGIF
jgi:hypothetical protein